MNPAEPDRPEFEVRVGGRPLEPAAAADVVELDVHEETGRHARVSLLVQNWDADRRAVRHSDDGPFLPGRDIAVSLGYHSELSTVFEGVVTALTAHFPRTGGPVLRVEARSRSILLDHPPRSRQLADATDADVAAAIAADYGLQADAAAGTLHPVFASDRASDWEVLVRRAAELGWVAYVRGTLLVFRPPAAPESGLELDWTRSLVELQLTQDLSRAVEDASGTGWDPDAVEPVEAGAGAASTGLASGARPRHDAAVAEAGWPLREARSESPARAGADDAGARALGLQRASALGHVHGTGAVPGNPALRCDSWLTISGVGRRLSGPHYVTAARHRFSPTGYRSEFQVGSPPRLLPPPAAGPGPAGMPLALGVVESLEDPQSLNRVRVRLPWRSDGGEGAWARIAGPDAGDGYGTVLVPDPGQEVLLGFVDGDPAHPVVLGSLFNGKQKAPFAVDPGSNAVRALVSPSGHALRLEDGDAGAIVLRSGAGHSVVLSDAESEIVVTHRGSGNAIKLSADGIELSAARGGITLKSPAGTIALDALALQAKASAPSAIQSTATLEVKASGSLGLKGSLITIN